jgi:hypothetical protein
MTKTLLRIAWLLYCFQTASSAAQSVPQGDYEGYEFWTAFMPNNGAATTTLIITSRYTTTATITTPLIAGGFNQTVTVTANGVVQVNIPATVGGINMSNPLINTPSVTGIRVTSPDPISVFGSNVASASSDSWLNIPSDKLGTDYISVAFTGYSTASPGLPSQVMVIATEPGTTTVNFTVPAGKSVQGLGSSFSATLSQGQTYLIQAPVGVSDAVELTGLRILSNKRIGVYGGVKCSGYPQAGNRGGYASCGPCDHMVEMITPTSSWGGTYVLALFDLAGANAAASGQMDSRGNFMRIVSAEAVPVTVSISGQPSVTLNGIGDYTDRRFTAHTVVTSSRKIMVYQIMGATTCYSAIPSSGVGDPCFTNISPVEQWGTRYAFATPNGAVGYTHYINIIKKSNAGTVMLDGVNQTGFVNIPGTDYYVKNAVTVAAGVHNLLGDSAFVVYSFGVEVAGSYCNQVSGASLMPIAVPVDFLDFTATASGKTVQLRWSVASEKNAKEYIVERMSGDDFEAAGFVPASGTSSVLRSYTYTDHNPQKGMNYYRLRQVDFDGKFAFTTSVGAEVRAGGVLITTPQPVKDVAELTLGEEVPGTLFMSVYDLTGRLVKTVSQKLEENTSGISLDVRDLHKGLYFLSLETPSGTTRSLKLLKE